MKALPKKFSERLMRVRSISTGTTQHLALLQATEEITGRDDFLSTSRIKEVVTARQALMCAARLSGATLETAALFAGLYDHTSCSFAVDKMKRDKRLKSTAEAILKRAKQMLAERTMRYNDGIEDMAKAIKSELTPQTNTPQVNYPKDNSPRPDVVALTRKPWEGDSPKAKEIARRRALHYG
jgi:hypothetical protein